MEVFQENELEKGVGVKWTVYIREDVVMGF